MPVVLMAGAAFLVAGCATKESSSPSSATTSSASPSGDGPSADSSVIETVPDTGATSDAAAPTVATATPSGSAGGSVVSSTGTAKDVANESTTAPPATAVSNVNVDPGQSDDGFVGAAADVTTKHCGAGDGGWIADGSVKNSSGRDARYRIYVAFNVKGSTDTKALQQVDVDVANGKTESWKAKAEVADTNLICILRVERTKA